MFENDIDWPLMEVATEGALEVVSHQIAGSLLHQQHEAKL